MEIKKVHGPYRNNKNREFVIIIDHNGGRRTVSYPKYLMEQVIGRKLDIDETIDHKDR